MIALLKMTINDCIYQMHYYLDAAREAGRIGWPEGRRQLTERPLCDRSEARRLKEVLSSRAAGMKTA